STSCTRAWASLTRPITTKGRLPFAYAGSPTTRPPRERWVAPRSARHHSLRGANLKQRQFSPPRTRWTPAGGITGTLPPTTPGFLPVRKAGRSLDRHALRQVARLVYVRAAVDGNVVGQELGN